MYLFMRYIFYRYSIVLPKPFKEGVLHVVQLVSDESVYVCSVDAVENIFFDILISLVTESSNESFGLTSF